MGLTADLRATLESAVNAVTGLPTSVARENTLYKPVANIPWRRDTLQPGLTTLESLPSSLALLGASGAYLVDLFYPVNLGIDVIDAAVDALTEAFPLDRQIDLGSGRTIRITSVRQFNGLRDGSWWMVPTEIRYVVDGLENAEL